MWSSTGGRAQIQEEIFAIAGVQAVEYVSCMLYMLW